MTDLELFVFITAHPGAVALTITNTHDDDDESDDDDGSGSDDGSGQGRERRRRRPGRAEVEVDDDAGSDASADSQSMSTKTDIFTMHDLLDYGRLPEFVTQVGACMTTYGGGREPHAHVRSALHTRSVQVRADVAAAAAAHPEAHGDAEALIRYVFHPRRAWMPEPRPAAPGV